MKIVSKPTFCKWERIAIYSVLVLLFVLAIWKDLPITQSLYSPGNAFGVIGELCAPIPCYFSLIFTTVLLARFIKVPKKRGLTKALKIIFLLLSFGVALYCGYHFKGNLNRDFGSNLGFLYAFLLGAGWYGLFAPFTFLVKETHRRQAIVFAVTVIVIYAIDLLLMQGLKMLWLRPRYRTLVALYGDNASSYWRAVYQPQGFWKFSSYPVATAEQMKQLGITSWTKEEFYSFPSGHVLNCAAGMSLCLSSSFFPKFKGKEWIVRSVFFGLGIVFAFSRIVIGAHNPTDVIAGLLIATLTYDLVATLLEPKFESLYLRYLEPKPKETISKL